MRPRAAPLVALLALLAAGAASAAGPARHWYAVEVVVFAWTDPAQRLTERWSEEARVPEVPEDAVEPGTLAPVPAGRPVASLPAGDASLLAETWARLERSGAVRPLVRAAWRQAPLGPDGAVPVRIRGGLPEGPWLRPEALEPPLSQESGDVPADQPGIAVEAGPYVPPEAVDGTVRVTLSRYLHVAVDLAYRGALPVEVTDPVTGAGMTTERRQVFRLHQRRRVRLGEVHYFDHPAFGVLVRVRRVPCPEGAGCAGADGTGGR